MLSFLNTLLGERVGKKERHILLSIAVCIVIVMLNAQLDFAQGYLLVIILAMLVWLYFGGLFFILRATLRSAFKMKERLEKKDGYGVFLYLLNAFCSLSIAGFYSGYFMPSTNPICPNDPGCDIQEMKMSILFGVTVLGTLYTLWKIRKYEDAAN